MLNSANIIWRDASPFSLTYQKRSTTFHVDNGVITRCLIEEMNCKRKNKKISKNPEVVILSKSISKTPSKNTAGPNTRDVTHLSPKSQRCSYMKPSISPSFKVTAPYLSAKIGPMRLSRGSPPGPTHWVAQRMESVLVAGKTTLPNGIFKLFKSWIKISSKYWHTWIFSPKTKTVRSHRCVYSKKK